MDRKLSFKEYILLASMLFGLFFGAGNLIFPASMGQASGDHFVWAFIMAGHRGLLFNRCGPPVAGRRCDGSFPE